MGFFSKLFGRKKKNNEAVEAPTKPIAQPCESTVEKEDIPTDTKAVSEKSVKEQKEAPVTRQEKQESKNQTPAKATPQDTTPAEKTASKNTVGFFEIKKSKDDRYVFNLYAANKVIIATSQIYSSSSAAMNGANSVIANAEKANVEDQTLKEFSTLPYPKWEIYKDKGGQFRFRLSASNGSCICHSQGYTSKASCKNGIESIIRTVKNAKIDKAYIKTKD